MQQLCKLLKNYILRALTRLVEQDKHSDEQIRRVLSLKKVTVIGTSRDPSKAAQYVPKYLLDNGYDVIPVNPAADEILGKKCYDSVSEINEDVEVIDIFRPSEQVLPFVQEAIKKRPKVIWLQEGIHNVEAEELARREGITVVFNRCMLAEHRRLMTDFENFYRDLLDLIGKYELQNIPLRIQRDPENDIIKILGEKVTSLAKAQNGLHEVTELAYTAAEHHPYWSLLYNSSEIAGNILEKWNGSLSDDDLSDVAWALKKLDQSLEKIKDS